MASLQQQVLRMKKYLILLLILSMCGGTAESDSDPFAEEMLVAKDVMTEKQKETKEEFKKSQENNTQSAPPPPSVNFDIIEIYNTKLITELCEDATQIENSNFIIKNKTKNEVTIEVEDTSITSSLKTILNNFDIEDLFINEPPIDEIIGRVLIKKDYDI